MLTMGTIICKPTTKGAPFEDTCVEAIQLSLQYRTVVRFQFNDEWFTVNFDNLIVNGVKRCHEDGRLK